MCCFFKLVIFFCGFSAKVTCAFLANKKQFGEFNRIKHSSTFLIRLRSQWFCYQWIRHCHLCMLGLLKLPLQSWQTFPSSSIIKQVVHIFITLIIFFLDKGCGHKLTHTNKNEISINLFPVCYQSLSIILFCLRSVLF